MKTVKPSHLESGDIDKREDTRQTEKSLALRTGRPIAEVIGGVAATLLGILGLTEGASLSVISLAITIIL